ncbi:GNAT family N-acetyltransferase [bacterium]|nr:GNAT family N-acetyltransferase [bacterium]MBU1065608.1 GNAT family N-acetyltransferase [bacterium]MBU1634625.1 GNAT family N-acetyltransferase [bacterium]MBU1872500.1 GNAT family N-acetyltransferase [bacterium]
MFKTVATLDDLIKVFIVRGIVFIDEQKVPYDIEMDEYEYSSLHVLGEIDGEPVAAGRLRFINEWAKLERIAVRKEYRNRGYGHDIVEFMLAVAREKSYHKFKMHAQAHLRDYYARHGFKTQGGKFKEADINHYLMTMEDSDSNFSK